MRPATALLLAASLLVLFALPDTISAQGASAQPISTGERAFQKCYSCHSLGDDDEGAPGPSLKGIVGRKVAAWQGYEYSPSMRAYAEKQDRWTRGALDAFLANPQDVVPDNEMGFFGLRDPGEREALISYLETR